MAKGMFNGYISAKGSKALSPAVKAKILEAPEGWARAFQVTLYDKEGAPVVLRGKAYLSKEGGLTAKVGMPLDFESLLIEVEADVATDEESLANSLL